MYVDTHFQRNGEQEIIRVVERVNGQRVFKEYAPDYHFFVSDPRGSYRTIYGDPVKKVQPKSYTEAQKLIKSISGNVTKWESDVDPIMRCIEQNYKNQSSPELHVAFFDIETSFDSILGKWSEASDANNYITSISIHLQWLNQLVCLALPPETLTWEEATEIAERVSTPESTVILFRKESEMLQAFMDVIEDADILSGWNSTAYDIPYTINRIKKVLGKLEAHPMCLWGLQPKVKEFEFGGRKQSTYSLAGRVHLDYMELYKKYNYEERQSYALNAIATVELNETKIQYNGTLDELYNDDFEEFLRYNIQDTRLLDKLDKKLDFIELANQIAHANCVPIPATMGSVKQIDQAIVIEAHTNNLICPNKKHQKNEKASRAAGGWVATPKAGLHKFIGSSDLKSLYPSVIRTLNMSPETIVGQVRLTNTSDAIDTWEKMGGIDYTFATWWNDRFNVLEMENFYSKDISQKLILDMESGDTFELTGAELHNIIFDPSQNWCISANGTIFKTNKQGIIPLLLSRWYHERTILQKSASDINYLIKKGIDTTVSIFSTDCSISIDLEKLRKFKMDDLNTILIDKNEKNIESYFDEYGLTIKDNKIFPKEQFKDLWEQLFDYYDKKQLIRKILLNSAYGALLNVGSRFFDQRLGQSTTLTGRTITRHMSAKTNEIIAGEYKHDGAAIIYNDTDSAYFSAYPMLKAEIEKGDIDWTKESIIDLYNGVAKSVSDTFPQFLKEKLNVPIERSTGVIASSRETVSETGLWIVKKRYACLMFDKDGIRLDVNGKPGKVKAMGLDLRRSDTPKFMQEFLSEILLDTLLDKGEKVVVDKVREFKLKFEDRKPWQQGTPRAVNKLNYYKDQIELAAIKRMKGEIVSNLRVPGHVSASLAWNRMNEIHNEKHAMRITDGAKIIVCKLKITPDNNLSSIAMPTDETRLPQWFINLPFAEDEMMAGIVDKKVQNLLGVLKWDFKKTTKAHARFESFFG